MFCSWLAVFFYPLAEIRDFYPPSLSFRTVWFQLQDLTLQKLHPPVRDVSVWV